MQVSAEMHSTAPGEQRTRWWITFLRVLGVLVALGALAVFAYYAARVTLSPVRDNGQAGGNLDPGRSLRFYLDKPAGEALIQLGGNLALLAPLGVLLPVVSVRLRGPVRLTLLGGMISLMIETVQGAAVLGRAFDVDDVILNAVGVVLAYLLVGRKVSHMVRGRR